MSGVTASLRDSTGGSCSNPEIGSNILSGSSAMSKERMRKASVVSSVLGCTKADAIVIPKLVNKFEKIFLFYFTQV
jgi:hypothetical protein